MANPRLSMKAHSGQTIVEYMLLVTFVVMIAWRLSLFFVDIFQQAAPRLKADVIERQLNTGREFR
ncbi:MAG: hypothetical protein HY390_06485 [Deltaproteobacteria bacterium]|nr:hypothetical protein [Deltaproteobacteria bacterium]